MHDSRIFRKSAVTSTSAAAGGAPPPPDRLGGIADVKGTSLRAKKLL